MWRALRGLHGWAHHRWSAALAGGGGSTSATRQLTKVLTTQGGDAYSFLSTAGAMDATALPTNTGGNLRTIFWPDGSPVVADSQSCAVWSAQSDAGVQQGAALRIRQSSTGRLRVITVTKNVIYGATWVFNFHTWDSSAGAVVRQGFGQKEVPALFTAAGPLAPLPWHFCARIVGSVVEFKVWTSTMAEPAWGNGTWGGRATVPTGWGTAGTTGWYVGHLGPSGTARFDDLRTWRFGGTPTPTTTTTTSTTLPTTATTSTSTTSTTATPTTVTPTTSTTLTSPPTVDPDSTSMTTTSPESGNSALLPEVEGGSVLVAGPSA